MTDPKMLRDKHPKIKLENESNLTSSNEMDHINSTEVDHQQERHIPALNGDQEPTTIINPPDLTTMNICPAPHANKDSSATSGYIGFHSLTNGSLLYFVPVNSFSFFPFK